MRRRSAARAALAWRRLALDWAATVRASAQVIAYRSARANMPTDWLAMGHEKMQAAIESAEAVQRRLLIVPPASPVALWTAWAKILSSGLRPYRARAVDNARKGPRLRP